MTDIREQVRKAIADCHAIPILNTPVARTTDAVMEVIQPLEQQLKDGASVREQLLSQKLEQTQDRIAELESTIAEQAGEIERLKSDYNRFLESYNDHEAEIVELQRKLADAERIANCHYAHNAIMTICNKCGWTPPEGERDG